MTENTKEMIQEKEIQQEQDQQVNLFEQWYELANTIDVDNLTTFAKTLKATTNTPEEILHSVVAAIKATTEAMLKDVEIEGMENIRNIVSTLAYRKINNLGEGFTSVTDFDNMLNPQAKQLFDKYITEDAFLDLQQKAINLLKETEEQEVHPALVAHWNSIAQGRVPFGYIIFEDEYRSNVNNYHLKEEETETEEEMETEVVEPVEIIEE